MYQQSMQLKTLGAIFCFLILGTTTLLSSDSFAETTIPELNKAAGKRSFENYCSGCHLGALPEAPKVEALKLYPPTRIVESLESGVMSTQGLQLSRIEKHQIAYFLTGKQIEPSKESAAMATCSDENIPMPKNLSEAIWNSWGKSTDNHRFQSNESSLTANNVSALSLKWAFAFPEATRVRSQPLVTPELTYIGSQSGAIFALDTERGCLHWQYKTQAEVRGALTLQHDSAGRPSSLIFGDIKANVYSIDASTGALNWQTNISYHPMATITGSVLTDSNNVYVPVSSLEVIPAARSEYECCTFRGALIALNISSGQKKWTSFTTEPPELRGKNSAGAFQFGPSGAPIWSSPTLDKTRNLIYVTTGQNYSSPSTNSSDAVIAIETQSGKQRWVSQVTENDAWNGGCVRNTANCPKENGPDFDIGASAMLVDDQHGKDWLIIGQKSGLVYGMDPEQQGKIIWTTRVGSGGTMGGVHWGMTANNGMVYVGVSDLPTNNPYIVGAAQPGVVALSLQTGKKVWRYTPPNKCAKGIKFRCYPGISAAISSSPGLIYAGGLDGMLRVLSANNGEVLWDIDTKQKVKTINGIEGFGGAIEADGPIVANGRLYVTSGYDKWGQMPGNLLLVFSLNNSK